MKTKKILFALVASFLISTMMTYPAMAVFNCVCGSTRTAWCDGYKESKNYKHLYFIGICEYTASLHSVRVYCNSSFCTQPTVYTDHINSYINHDCGEPDYWGNCSGGNISSWF